MDRKGKRILLHKKSSSWTPPHYTSCNLSQMTSSGVPPFEGEVEKGDRRGSPSYPIESGPADRISTVECSSPIGVRVDVDSAGSNNGTSSMASGQSSALPHNTTNLPKILNDVTWDPDGTRRSIEIEPLFGESKENCKARIKQLFDELQNDLRRRKCPWALLCSLIFK